MSNRKVKRSFYLFLLGILLLLIIYNVYRLVSLLYDNHQSHRLLEDVTKQVQTELEGSTETEVPGEKESLTYYDLEKLKQINSDTIGWIEVESTNISYPLVQTTDNDYYLNYSFDKRQNRNGWVFMDAQNDASFADQNTVIYAHNSIFTALRDKYDNRVQDPFYIYIYQEKYRDTYEVFSLYLTTPDDLVVLASHLSSETLAKIQSSSIINNPTKIGEEDRILTLATCYYDRTKRIIVHAKFIDRIEILT